MKSKKTGLPKRFGLTMGDPAGIGPEISLKAIRLLPERLRRKLVLIGDRRAIGDKRGMASLLKVYDPQKEPPNGSAAFLDLNILPPAGIKKGKLSASSGIASFKYIEKAVELCLEGKLAGIVTAPINKKALSMANLNYPGHTEMLWELSGKTGPVTMMFISSEIQLVLLSTHLPLRKAIAAVKTGAVLEKLKIIQKELNPVKPIAVCGLNPHASEKGLFGDEEEKAIIPAIAAARKIGIKVEGPLPADTVFSPNIRKKYGVILAMYHDQGLVGIKSVSFGNCVNVTLGLPFIRTSVDHGTAYDIAKKGIADPSSMGLAIKTAFKLNGVKQKLEVI